MRRRRVHILWEILAIEFKFELTLCYEFIGNHFYEIYYLIDPNLVHSVHAYKGARVCI